MQTIHYLLDMPLPKQVARIGVLNSDDSHVRTQKGVANLGIVFGLIPVHLIYLAFTVWHWEFWLVVQNLSMVLFFGLAVALFAIFKSHFALYKFLGVSASIVSPMLAVFLLGGLDKTGYVALFGLCGPAFSLMVYSRRQAFIAFLVFTGLLALSVVLHPLLRTTNSFPPLFNIFGSGLTVLMVTIVVCLELLFFIEQRDIAFDLLRIEQDKSEAPLLNILPKDISDFLKRENKVFADHFDAASILFADVVGFTKISANMNPMELVEILNDVFSHFDTLAEKYGLEKIKTIGDCYMVASGIPRSRPDHAQALAHMALDMQGYIAKYQFRGISLTFRIGINSGPVIAGVIGRKKFIYDLWGDAVNIASRMESHGEAGQIQITRDTYELLKNNFVCEARSPIAIKGKGNMPVWHLKSAIVSAKSLTGMRAT